MLTKEQMEQVTSLVQRAEDRDDRLLRDMALAIKQLQLEVLALCQRTTS